jgi:hypothetical protein
MMSWRLNLLGKTFVPCVKLQMLDELARVTAEGFDADLPEWAGGSFAERMVEYAEFTADKANLLVISGDQYQIEKAQELLRSGAARLGTSLRSVLGVRTAEEAFEALKLLYGQIGIDIDGGPYGEMTVSKCFFADYYDGRVCRIVEALDQGLMAGLSEGGSLQFSERLTEGRPLCRALLRPTNPVMERT